MGVVRDEGGGAALEQRPCCYAILDGELEGPLTLDALAVLVRATRASADTPVWREGVEEWTPLSEVLELGGYEPASARASSAPPPLPKRDTTILPSPITSPARVSLSSGSVDIGALLRTSPAEVERAQRLTPLIEAPLSIAVPRDTAATLSRRAQSLRTALGGAALVVLALAPWMASIARAPAPMERDGSTRSAVARASTAIDREAVESVSASATVGVARAPEATTAEVAPRAPQPAASRTAATRRARVEVTHGSAAPAITETSSPIAATEEVREVGSAEAPAPMGSTEMGAPAPEPVGQTAAAQPAARQPESAGVSPAPTLDGLIEAAVGGRAEPARGEPASGAPEVPLDGPTRDDIDRGLYEVRADVMACGASGQHGVANVRLQIAGSSGRVTSALVMGELAGTPAGSCVARAVRGARFLPFERPSFTIQYPFRI